jgi:hypothetical protein
LSSVYMNSYGEKRLIWPKKMSMQVRDHREDWPLNVTQPVAGNYYPVKFFHSINFDFTIFIIRWYMKNILSRG